VSEEGEKTQKRMRLATRDVLLATFVVLSLASRFGIYGLGLDFGADIGTGLGLGLGEGNVNADLRAKMKLNMSSDVDDEEIDFAKQTARGFLERAGKTKVSAQFVAESAEIRVFREDQKSWVLHRFLAARETNTTGDVTLALMEKKSWSDGEASVFNGVNCTKYTLQTNLAFVSSPSTKVALNLTALLFNNEYNFTLKGREYKGTYQTVKFSFRMGAWPFQANSVGLSVFSLVKASGNANKTRNHGFVAGDAALTFPVSATVDGIESDVNISVSFKAFGKSTRAAAIVEVLFPKFTNALEYDPVVGLDADSNGSSRGMAAMSFSVLMVLLMTLALL
jgi:hypothetical protein